MKKSNVYRLVGNGALAMIKEAYRLNNNKEDIDVLSNSIQKCKKVFQI